MAFELSLGFGNVLTFILNKIYRSTHQGLHWQKLRLGAEYRGHFHLVPVL